MDRMTPLGTNLRSFRLGAQGLPLTLVVTLALSSAAAAETLTYGVDAGIAETNNVNLAPMNEVSQTMAVVDMDFDVKQLTRLFDLDAKGNFTDLDYLQHAYGNQLVGRFDGTGKFALIPERLTWVVQDDFGQQALDPFTPQTPNNLENVNYLSTGPDVALRFGGTSFLNLSARIARAQYETSPFNSNRVLGDAAWGFQLSPASTISLNADTERVLFENTLVNTDFDRTNAFVRYEIQGARTSFSADLGGTQIEQGGTSTSGALARVQLTRTISAAAKLTLSAGRDLTDGSTSFSTLPAGAIGIVGTAPASLTSASYTSDYGSAGWQYVRNRTTVGVTGRWEKDVYRDASQFDLTRGGAEFSVERRMTPDLTAQLLGRYYKTNYPHAVLLVGTGAIVPNEFGVTTGDVIGASDYADALVGASLSWRHGRAMEVRLRVEHTSRETTGIDAGYHESRIYLTIGYRPRPVEPESDPGANAPG
jgi:hypothetical protein